MHVQRKDALRLVKGEESSDMPGIILVRIAQTENNVVLKWSGRKVDSPLTERERAMANYVADLLNSAAPSVVYSGPTPRCRETARLMAQQWGLPVVV